MGRNVELKLRIIDCLGFGWVGVWEFEMRILGQGMFFWGFGLFDLGAQISIWF
jgi:hypothetical protein